MRFVCFTLIDSPHWSVSIYKSAIGYTEYVFPQANGFSRCFSGEKSVCRAEVLQSLQRGLVSLELKLEPLIISCTLKPDPGRNRSERPRGSLPCKSNVRLAKNTVGGGGGGRATRKSGAKEEKAARPKILGILCSRIYQWKSNSNSARHCVLRWRGHGSDPGSTRPFVRRL